MKLHHNPASPFVRMVMVTAHELNMADNIELIDTGEFLPDRVNIQVAADNPLGRIPALVIENVTTIYDSRVICEFLCTKTGDTDILPTEPENRFRLLTLQALATGLMDSGVALRYETGLRQEAKRWDEWIVRQQTRFAAALDDLEQNHITDLQSVNCGSIATACVLGYFDFRYPDMGWRDGRPQLAAFYEQFSARPSMTATQPPAA